MTSRSNADIKRDIAKLEADIAAALASPRDDRELRDHLEQLAQNRAFAGYTWRWGPVLYARNRPLFRPLILARFSEYRQVGRWRWTRVRWRDAPGKALTAWLGQADTDDDVELFRRLYAWQLGELGSRKAASAAWRKSLKQRFTSQDSPARRMLTLAKLDLPMALDEDTALALYRVDAKAAAPFILKHLRTLHGEGSRGLWTQLSAAAHSQQDLRFADALYRRQVHVKDWERDVAALAKDIADPTALCQTLERRHPEGVFQDLGGGFFRLIELRGRDVLPYVRKHLRQVWSSWLPRTGYDRLLALAEREGWLDLWSALVVICSRPKEYNKAVEAILNDRHLAEEERLNRLHLLAGVSREWNFGGFGLAQIHKLDPKLATQLYARFPDLVRGPFRAHVAPSWWEPYESLLEQAIANGDDGLVDFLSSRLVTRLRWGDSHVTKAAERAAAYYESLRLEPTDFARRAAAVLTQVPAFAIQWYDKLIEENRLARLLFERSAAAMLSDPGAVRELVEASEIHVQQLAYRTLSRRTAEATTLAADNLPILLGTLLRPLHRATRLAAFGALANAAHLPASAPKVLERARMAQALPDRRYPKEQLIGLIGHVLHRHPQLAEPAERPVVYRRTPA